QTFPAATGCLYLYAFAATFPDGDHNILPPDSGSTILRKFFLCPDNCFVICRGCGKTGTDALHQFAQVFVSIAVQHNFIGNPAEFTCEIYPGLWSRFTLGK